MQTTTETGQKPAKKLDAEMAQFVKWQETICNEVVSLVMPMERSHLHFMNNEGAA